MSADIEGGSQIAGIIVRTDVDVLTELTESRHSDFVGGGTGLRD